MSSRDQANIEEKLGLAWRNRKKISQIINAYIYIPFFLLIILCSGHAHTHTYGHGHIYGHGHTTDTDTHTDIGHRTTRSITSPQ